MKAVLLLASLFLASCVTVQPGAQLLGHGEAVKATLEAISAYETQTYALVEVEEGVKNLRQYLSQSVMGRTMSEDAATAVNNDLRALDYYVTSGWTALVEGRMEHVERCIAAARASIVIVQERLQRSAV